MPAPARKIHHTIPRFTPVVDRAEPDPTYTGSCPAGDAGIAELIRSVHYRPLCLQRIACAWRRLSPATLRARLANCPDSSRAARHAATVAYLADLCGRVGPRGRGDIEALDALSPDELNRLVQTALRRCGPEASLQFASPSL